MNCTVSLGMPRGAGVTHHAGLRPSCPLLGLVLVWYKACQPYSIGGHQLLIPHPGRPLPTSPQEFPIFQNSLHVLAMLRVERSKRLLSQLSFIPGVIFSYTS